MLFHHPALLPSLALKFGDEYTVTVTVIFKKDTSNLLDLWIMKQNLHSIADTNVKISKNIFVVGTCLHSELCMQQIIIVTGSCTPNKA